MANVTLARYRNTDYTVRCEIDGNMKQYTWKGSQGNKVDKKKVPQEVVDWLNMNTQCFSKGKLVLEGEGKVATSLKEDFAEPEIYEANTNSREEILEALQGHHKTLEKFLSEITVDDEKRFIIDVAVEIKDELTGATQNRIAEFAGVDRDILFD